MAVVMRVSRAAAPGLSVPIRSRLNRKQARRQAGLFLYGISMCLGPLLAQKGRFCSLGLE